jgi:hypothetical protein
MGHNTRINKAEITLAIALYALGNGFYSVNEYLYRQGMSELISKENLKSAQKLIQ